MGGHNAPLLLNITSNHTIMAVILKDLQGNIIGTMASESYTPTRILRNRREQELCDKAMGIVREPKSSVDKANMRRINRGQEPIFDSPGVRRCNCEDYPCCGH